LPGSRSYPAPLGWALSPEAARWAHRYAGDAFFDYADPDREHPYDYETELIRQLHAIPRTIALP
jgi:hypothetical protein